jgi:hypothetical protein
MDAFEAARLKHAKNKANQERSRANALNQASAEKAVETEMPATQQQCIREPAPQEPPRKEAFFIPMKDGEINVDVCFNGGVHKFRFHCPNLTGSVMTHHMKQQLLEALAAKFGRRVGVK